MDYDSFLELVKKRRSIRRFKPDPVPDEYIDKIIEAARWAPSGFNMQPWEFVVVKDPKIKDNIVQILRKDMAHHAEMEATREPWQGQALSPQIQPGQEINDFSKAPVFIIVFGDTRTIDGLPMTRRFSRCQPDLAYTSGLASAMLYMHLAATTLGLGSQWVSAIGNPKPHCLLKALLGIPKDLEVYDMMVVGYPAYKPRGKLLRAKGKMVHYDYCGEGDFRTDEEVKAFIKKTRAWVIANQRRDAD